MKARVREIHELFNNAILEVEQHSTGSTHLAEEIYFKSNDINYEAGMELSLLIYGVLNYLKGDYSQALNYYKRCRDSQIKIHDPMYYGYLYKAIGDLYLKQGNYSESLSTYYKALSHMATNKDIHNLKMRIYGNIGYIYVEIEVFDKAYEYLHHVLDLCQLEGITKCLSLTYAMIGLSMLKEDHPNEAISYFDKSLHEAKENGDKNDMAFAYFNYGRLYFNKKEYELALKYFHMALELYVSLELDQWEAGVYAAIGELYFNIHKYEESESYLMKSNLLILGKNNKVVELKIDGLLGQIYEYQKQYEKSLTYYKRYYTLKEENDKYWKIIKVNDTISQYEEEEATIKIKELEYENVILQTLSEFGRQITSTLDVNEIIATVMKNINQIIIGDLFIIALKDETTIDYNMLLDYNLSIGKTKVNNKHSVISRLTQLDTLEVNEYILAENPIAGRIILKREGLEGINMRMSCPLIFEGQIIGSIIIGRRNDMSFVSRDKEILLLICSYMSIAIHNWEQSKRIFETNKKLKVLTEFDALTKVYNRYALNNNTAMILAKAKRNPHPLSILMIDIDFFKEYNDYYGHLEGDKCLQEVANVLKNVYADMDAQIYRYGGDEFLIILYDIPQNEVTNVGEYMRGQVEGLHIDHHHSSCSKYVTLTVGIGTIVKPMDEINEGFALADRALYRAKNRGRNNVQQIIN